jgi:hypothetical protein
MNKGLRKKKTTGQIWPGLGRSSACRPNSKRGQRPGAPTGRVHRSVAGRAKRVPGSVGRPIKLKSMVGVHLQPPATRKEGRNPSTVGRSQRRSWGLPSVTATGRGDAAWCGDLDEGRLGREGPRGAVLHGGHGEDHLGTCRHLASGVPGPKERAG